MKIVISIFGFLFLTLSACQTDPNIPATPEVSFQSGIQPILTGGCGQDKCHAKNGYASSLIGYEDVINNGGVVAGNARKSKLYRVVSNRSLEPMPPNPEPPLASQDIKLIYVWIEQGAKNN